MDGGAWWATVRRVAKSQTRLSDFTHSLSVCVNLDHSWAWVFNSNDLIGDIG